LSQITCDAISKPIPLEARGDFGGVHAGVPDVANLQARDDGVGVRPIDSGVTREGRVLVTLDAHVGLLGRAERVVQMISPGRVEADAVGRIRREEPGGRPAEQTGHVVGVGGIAAQQAVIAEHPQLAWLDVRLLRWLRYVVGVSEARLAGTEIAEQPQEAGVVDAHLGEQFVQFRLVGRRHGADRIERRQDEGLLLGREVDVQDRHARFVPADRQRDARVAVDDEARPLVDHDLLDPANRVERAGQRRLLVAWMETPVAGIGEKLVGRLFAGAGDPVAPGRRQGSRRRLRRHRATPDLWTCIVAPSE